MPKAELYINRPIPKRYMKVADMADEIGVNSSCVRFYTNSHSHIIKPKRDKKGNRIYDPKSQEMVKEIHRLIEDVGLTHRGVDIHFERKQAVA